MSRTNVDCKWITKRPDEGTENEATIRVVRPESSNWRVAPPFTHDGPPLPAGGRAALGLRSGNSAREILRQPDVNSTTDMIGA